MWQFNGELSSDVFLTLERNRPARSLYDVVGQRKAYARTACFGGEIGKENLAFVLFLDAFSVVFHADDERCIPVLQQNLYPAIRLVSNGLHGIFDQVADGAVEVGLVAIESMVFGLVIEVVERDVLRVVV